MSDIRKGSNKKMRVVVFIFSRGVKGKDCEPVKLIAVVVAVAGHGALAQCTH
jgi:hypothetical protein